MESKKILFAAALAGLALAANASDAVKTTSQQESKEIEGQCHGINSCKGTSACHGQSNSCAGTNSCKGKGWLKSTEKACKQKKGTFKNA